MSAHDHIDRDMTGQFDDDGPLQSPQALRAWAAEQLVHRLAAEAEDAETAEDDGLPLPEGTTVTRGLTGMSATHDPKVGTYVYLTDRPVARTVALSDSVNVDLDADDNPVGVEVLHVSRASKPLNGGALYLDTLERMSPPPEVQAVIDRLRAENES